MIWIVVVVGVVVVLYVAIRMGSTGGGDREREEHVPQSTSGATTSAPITPNAATSSTPVSSVTITANLVAPEPQEWERERVERKRVREAAIERVRSEFVRPATVAEAVDGVRGALAALALARSVPEPDPLVILTEARLASTPVKMELTVRKRLNAAYRLRADPAMLHEALACCLVQVQLTLEYPDSTWKVASALKRIANNLDHERYRTAAIGFLLVIGDALREDRPDVAASCDEEAACMFSNWWADENARARFQTDLAQIERTTSASDKHFLINGLAEYLDRCRRFDPSVRSQLVALCEQDVALYKTFLADFHRDGQGRASFARAVKSEHYMCPRLPSFDILWDIFEEEREVGQLRRLQKLAKEIKYGDFDIDDDLEAAAATPASRVDRAQAGESPTSSEAGTPAVSNVPTEVIEVGRSGQTGKLSFLNSSGEPCSTEDAADDHFRSQGWKTLRAEVRFWQAMFGLVFWDEIFAGTGAPNAMNDIPVDLFSGAPFYDARCAAIDARAALIARSDLRQLVTDQLRRHGATWTRIVFDGPRADFSYRHVLESADAADSLATIPPATFAKIVHRIATNPSEHRAGVADYVMWKDGAVVFVEVKGIREKLRDSQSAWIAWMLAEGITVKVVRVKGVATPASTPLSTGG